MSDGQLHPDWLVRGYGGAVNQAIRKKAYKAIGIKGPRTNAKSWGDFADLASYYGMSVIDAAKAQKAGVGPRQVHRNFYYYQHGVDLMQHGYDAYRPWDMIKYKDVPYIAQKLIRRLFKNLR
jgi:hypothetical protein